MVTLGPGTFRDVPGFRAAGVHAGLKRSRRDVALLVSDAPASGAAVYTRNLVRAAPLEITREHLSGGTVRGIVVNSGNANACTGDQGLADARRMAEVAADALGVAPREILVASTGVIGRPLHMEKVEAGILATAQALAEGQEGGEAEALLTTDTQEKEVLATFQAAGVQLHVGGLAKGSGMIHPNMGTMLAFLATDAAVAPQHLQEALTHAVDATFNQVTVDGDTSTNDMVAVLAGGASGVVLHPHAAGWDAFLEALEAACRHLGRAIAADGEGASTLLTVHVTGAASVAEARAAARTVAGSSLVKAAVFGRDPNWGRIVAALGRSGAAFDPQRVNLALGTSGPAVRVVREGAAVEDADLDALAKVLAAEEVLVYADLGAGEAEGTAWGCDLTYDYVRINAEYTT